MLEIEQPLSDEIARNLLASKLKTEDIGNLCGKNSQGNPAGKPYDDRIRDELDNGTQLEYPQQDEEYTCHESSHGQPADAILLNDAIDDDDERTRRSANLYLASAQQRNDETCHDGCDDTLFR